jgi:hypothetical protein
MPASWAFGDRMHLHWFVLDGRRATATCDARAFYIHAHETPRSHDRRIAKHVYFPSSRCRTSLRCLVPGVLVICRRGCEHPPGILGIRDAKPPRIRATAACEVTNVV